MRTLACRPAGGAGSSASSKRRTGSFLSEKQKLFPERAPARSRPLPEGHSKIGRPGRDAPSSCGSGGGGSLRVAARGTRLAVQATVVGEQARLTTGPIDNRECGKRSRPSQPVPERNRSSPFERLVGNGLVRRHARLVMERAPGHPAKHILSAWWGGEQRWQFPPHALLGIFAALLRLFVCEAAVVLCTIVPDCL